MFCSPIFLASWDYTVSKNVFLWVGLFAHQWTKMFLLKQSLSKIIDERLDFVCSVEQWTVAIWNTVILIVVHNT